MPHHNRRTRRPVVVLVAAIVAASLILVYKQSVSVSGRGGATQTSLTASRSLNEESQGRPQSLVTVNGERRGQADFSLARGEEGSATAASVGANIAADGASDPSLPNAYDTAHHSHESLYYWTPDTTLEGSSSAKKDLSKEDTTAPSSPTPIENSEKGPPYRIMAVVSTYDDNLDWLLEDKLTGSPIVHTEIYQIADLGGACEPVFPRLPIDLVKFNVSARPQWPEWAQSFVDSKCAMKEEAEPMSVFDVERRARLEAGLPWGSGSGDGAGLGKRRRRNLQEAQISIEEFDKAFISAAAKESYFHEGASLPRGLEKESGNDDEAQNLALMNDNGEEKLGVINVEGMNELRAHFGLPPLYGDPNQGNTASRDATNIDDSNNADRESSNTVLPFTSTITVPSISPLPLHIIPGMGRESMAYLTSIINNYENLPDVLVMMHGHESSWHSFPLGQAWGLKRLRDLPPRNLTMGFMQLGCMQRDESFLFPRVVDANHASANGPRWKESMAGHFMQAWIEHLGEAFGDPMPPRYIQAACCASFAVTREAIQRRPRSFYVGLREWLLTTPQDKYWAGVAIEFSWHMAFTGQHVYDPPVDQCRKELYDL